MKKFLTLILLATLFVGCSSDDDDNYSNSDIVGSWVLQSTVAKEVKTNNDKATKAIKDDIAAFDDDEDTYTFASDGKVTVFDGEDSYSGTYNLSGNKLTMDLYGVETTVNISISGNTFSADIDEIEYYQDEIEYLVPNEKDVVVSKVITTYTYKRK